MAKRLENLGNTVASLKTRPDKANIYANFFPPVLYREINSGHVYPDTYITPSK